MGHGVDDAVKIRKPGEKFKEELEEEARGKDGKPPDKKDGKDGKDKKSGEFDLSGLNFIPTGDSKPIRPKPVLTSSRIAPASQRTAKPAPQPTPQNTYLPPKDKYEEYAEERNVGFLDLDDWNALPEEDRNRIRHHSVKLYHTFRPAKYVLHVLGLFPFQAKKLDDGSYTFRLNRCSFFYLYYVLMTMVLLVVFVLFTLGSVFIFTEVFASWHVYDRCGRTWGKAVMSRNSPAIVFIWSNLMVATAGCVYLVIHSQKFLQFYNVVNEAVMQMDTDATHGVHKAEVQSLIIFMTVFVTIIISYMIGHQHSIEEAVTFAAQAVFYFQYPDLHLVGTHKLDVYGAKQYEEMLPKCESDCAGCFDSSDADEARCSRNKCYNHINTPTPKLRMYRWFGFIIMAYSLLASRAVIRQFEFFCQVLVNLASMWNKRFLNYASKDNTIKMTDVYRRRITDQFMLKDHYQIVKLYDVAEANFSYILFIYYASVFFNLICQFYFAALLSTQVTCAEAVERERKAATAGLCYINQSLSVDNNVDVLNAGLQPGDEGIVSFEDACDVQHRGRDIIENAGTSTTVLLILTMSSFVFTTVQADRASHQADIGFHRVRRKGYLSCRTKEERQSMHALVFSFTGPKPFAITAAGFFPIRKHTIIVLTSVAFIYFLIILSFKPGMSQSGMRCYTYSPTTSEQEFVVKYPTVI